MKDFTNKIGRLKRKKVKKQSYKSNKKYVLEIFEALYNGLNIIIEAFEKQILESKYRPVEDKKSRSFASYDYESHNLTDKVIQMFRKFTRT